MKQTLKQKERIRKKKDFLELYKKGYRHRGNHFNFIYRSNSLNFSRMGVVVSKKIGSAVKRNRIKRRLRALFRTNKELLKKSVDLLIIPKKEALNASPLSLKLEYLSALQKIFQNKKEE